MREILFRGFHPCDGPDTIVVDGEKVKGRWVEGYYMLISKTNFILPTGKLQHDAVNVLPSTVCQYTGLTDKNGKKVFVGDIVRCSRGCPLRLYGFRNTVEPLSEECQQCIYLV